MSSQSLFRYPQAHFAKKTDNKKLTAENEETKESSSASKKKRVSKKATDELPVGTNKDAKSAAAKKTKKNAKI